MRRVVFLFALVTGCSSAERPSLDSPDRIQSRDLEQLDVPRKQRAAVFDMSTWPPSNAGGNTHAPFPRP